MSTSVYSSSSLRGLAGTLALVVALPLSGAACTGNITGSDGTDTGAGGPGGPGGPNGPGGPGGDVGRDTPDGVGWATRFPKLSNQQWENTVRDLFYLDAATGLSSSFLAEPADGGYINEAASTITIAGDFWTRYQVAAEAVAKLVSESTTNLDKLTPAGAPSALPDKARVTIEKLGRRAYRRPLSTQEVDAYVTLFNMGAAIGSGGFSGGMNLVIQTLLQSPHFLYRVESSAKAEGERIWLSGFEVATRLSYAVWNTMPSDALLDAAASGELAKPTGVQTWATTLLADPRAATSLREFHEQTYHTGVYGTQSKDDRFAFDSAALAPHLKAESRLFFEEVIAEGGGIRALLTKPVAFVNA
ncbi:MAG: DUF1592 domain-containing protein, partial [Clostridia bacterium]|nr:DUF1592 domain-containing protein [Deltaproteobacteria bacterium]